MADAEWANFKQLRGRTLPETFTFRGSAYVLATLFKRDFYAATGLYQLRDSAPTAECPQSVVLKIYHTDPLGMIPLRWLGRMLCDREVRYYLATEGIPGLARCLGRHGEAGYVREYVPGCHLREYRKTHKLPADFYPRLFAMLAAVHARGVSHNDLSKAENILVRPDGSPSLIDFQIAADFRFRFRLLRYLGRQLLSYMQSVDRYHLGKHHRKDRPQDFTAAELAKSRRKGLLLTLHGWLLRRPYRLLRHLVMDRFMRMAPAHSAAAGTESSRSKAAPPPARAA
jgi:hypothetical protein